MISCWIRWWHKAGPCHWYKTSSWSRALVCKVLPQRVGMVLCKYMFFFNCALSWFKDWCGRDGSGSDQRQDLVLTCQSMAGSRSCEAAGCIFTMWGGSLMALMASRCFGSDSSISTHHLGREQCLFRLWWKGRVQMSWGFTCWMLIQLPETRMWLSWKP